MANLAVRIFQQVGRWKTKIRLEGKIPPDPPSQPNVTEMIAEGRKAIERMFPTTQAVESGHTGKADYQDIDNLMADALSPAGPRKKVGFMDLASHHPAELLVWLSLVSMVVGGVYRLIRPEDWWDLPPWLISTIIGLLVAALIWGIGPVPGKWIMFWVTLDERRRRRAR
jgi:hypothetical protein